MYKFKYHCTSSYYAIMCTVPCAMVSFMLCAKKVSKKVLAALQQLICGSGAPVGVFHVEENTGFFKPPERVFPSGGNAGTLPVALMPIYMPEARRADFRSAPRGFQKRAALIPEARRADPRAAPALYLLHLQLLLFLFL